MIGTDGGGLYRINSLQKRSPYYRTGETVFTVYKEPDGAAWIGLGNSLLRTDAGGHIQKKYLIDSRSNSIDYLIKDHEGKFWMATEGGGLNRFDPQTKQLTHYRHNRKDTLSLISNIVGYVYEDREGNIWAGTNVGLEKLDRERGTFTHYRHDERDTTSLSSNGVVPLLEDHHHQFWVGMVFGGGVNLMDRQTGKCKRYLKGRSVNYLYEDAEGVLWAGANDNLYRFNIVSDTFLPFMDSTSGMRFNNVFSILEDNQRNLWAFTRRNVIRLNPQRTHTIIVSKMLGIRKMVSVGLKGPQGEFFVGDDNGFYTIYPDQIRESRIPPQVTFMDLLLGEQPVKPGKSSPLNVPIAEAQEIRFNYKQNTFAILSGKP